MSPRKSGQNLSEAIEFQTAFAKVCREADVQVIPALKIIPSPGDGRNWTRKTCEKPDEMPSLAMEFECEDDECGGRMPASPPVVRVTYDRCESGECPVAVACRAFYVEYALLQAIFACVATFSTIVTLKLEDCCIGCDVVRMLATALAEFPGNGILDLSLDGNADVADELPSLLRTQLEHLSLRRCNLDDDAVNLLSRELRHPLERERNLLVLNLNMNRIGDEGAFALATALRTNRTLVSLSLCGNRITDVGASHLAEVLGKFCLTPEECTYRRRRAFDRLLLSKSILLKLVNDWKLRAEEENQTRIGSSDRIPGKRTKSFDVGPKRSSIASRDKKRANSSRVSSREKVRSRRKSNGNEGSWLCLEPSPSEMKELKLRSERETPPDGHPFATEVTVADTLLWCGGCWSLGNLNLSHNRITEYSLDKFLASMYHRDKSTSAPPHKGFLRLLIEPGNSIPRDSPKLVELESISKNLWFNRGKPSDGSAGVREHAESLAKKK